MIYGFTGHRPPRLGGYGKEARQKLYNFAYKVVTRYLRQDDESVGFFPDDSAIIGMAQGWDMAVAEACYVLHVPYTAAVPYPGQELVWPDREVREQYKHLIDGAFRVVYVCDPPGNTGQATKFLQLRNQWTVDHSNKLIALYSGDLTDPTVHHIRGGTYNCIKYAERQKKEVINVWPEWEKFNVPL